MAFQATLEEIELYRSGVAYATGKDVVLSYVFFSPFYSEYLSYVSGITNLLANVAVSEGTAADHSLFLESCLAYFNL